MSCRFKPCLQRQMFSTQTNVHSSVLFVLHQTGLKTTDTGILKGVTDNVKLPNLTNLTLLLFS